jgi:hypothetical protein
MSARPGWRVTDATVPVSSTIPVNIVSLKKYLISYSFYRYLSGPEGAGKRAAADAADAGLPAAQDKGRDKNRKPVPESFPQKRAENALSPLNQYAAHSSFA